MKIINIWINEKDLTAIVDVLHKLLANEHLLYIKTRNYHWNVTGPHFVALHWFFEEIYKAVEEEIDETAERIRMLWHNVEWNMSNFIKYWDLNEVTNHSLTEKEMLGDLNKDFELMIRQIRESVEKVWEEHGDKWTEDYLIWLMQKFEKYAWMIRSQI